MFSLGTPDKRILTCVKSISNSTSALLVYRERPESDAVRAYLISIRYLSIWIEDDPNAPRERHRYPQAVPRILLTNGRFPVSLDLARQFTLAGCKVYCVDPMKFHVCRFSRAVKASRVVPAPHTDAKGYIEGVKNAVKCWGIDHLIPVHEEEYYLAESKDPEILEKLYAPPWELLVRLHSKRHYAQMVSGFGLDIPEIHVCSSMDDVRRLDIESKEWALKPVFGRANTNVYHLKPGEPVPEDIPVSEEVQYVAQEWISGDRYCSYSVFNHGELKAHGVYPVLETIDGSSSVYFQSCPHPKIKEYVEKLGEHLYPFHGQIGLDFVDTQDRLVAFDCNPRATSGVHLWSGTPQLASAFTSADAEFTGPPRGRLGLPIRRQVFPGMLMWEHRGVNVPRYLKHMWRLVRARDIVWDWVDVMPSLASPVLLTYYYILCQRHKMKLPDLFQWQLIWEPTQDITKDVPPLL
ncbi:hypothetical protein BJY01DRAFT_239203 [Aspergillus pseudoustus]|uniref:ATP-grasp fold PylC-type domain-containing protein n=1 Tax=Aspergillus pseudoustus TaxID=1810923 RepID=A0ABR4J274_9EURO